MPLDVGGDVLEIVQRVCDRALNVATASAKSSTHGAKAGMRALRGRTVKHLPDGEGVVKDRALKLAVQKEKRRSGPSGASNWPQGPRVARERSGHSAWCVSWLILQMGRSSHHSRLDARS